MRHLYQSRRADVVYGSGGQEEIDWDAYGGKYRPNGRSVPANYRNAGARIVGYARTGRIVLETHRGTEVARLPFPPAGAVLNGHRGLVSGDLFLVPRKIAGRKIAVRYGPTYSGRPRIATGYQRTGVSVEFPVPEDCRQQGRSLWGVFRTEKPTYWEHGATVAECRAEHERKLGAADEKRREV